MPTPLTAARPLTLAPAARSTVPARPAVSASLPSAAPARPTAASPDAWASTSYPGYPAYPPHSPQPSLWNGVKLVAQGLGEILWVTAKAAGTLLQWAGVAAVAILGVAWDITKAVFNGLARGLRAIFDPGYDPYRPWQHGEPPPPSSNWRF